ncbi:MAG: disulfide oxidoreductase [Dehalococcoidia bacterium]|tara:strand:+ start:249 stop:812 length:564 start_codon:yes stop_codon:yes gene_type:complete
MNDIATEALNKIFSILAIVSISISAIIFITYLFSKLFSAKLSIISNFNKLIYDNSVVFSWAIATLATFGSLFYSEVSGFIPCTFCWYERIAMYPLVLILGIGIIKKNHEVWIYAFPFSLIGLLVSIYHYQLQMFPDQSSISCSTDVSCSGSWILEFGFVTMPFMALSTFLLISVLLLIPNIIKKEDN